MIRSVEARGRPPKEPPRDPPKDPPGNRPRKRPPVPYTELHSHSAFSFLDGASTPEQLVAEALRLELSGLAITDHDGLYGIVRFCEAARDVGLKTVYGAELSLGLPEPQLGVPDPVGEHLLVIARGQEGYRRLSLQIAKAQLAGGEKGRPVYNLDRLAGVADGHWLVLTGCRKGGVRRALVRAGPDAARREILELVERFGRENVAVELTRHLVATDDEDNDALAGLAADLRPAGGRHDRGALRRSGRGPARCGDGCGARQAFPGGGGPLPPRRAQGRTCAPGPRWRTCSGATHPPCRPRRRSARSAPSTCGWSHPNCLPTTCPRATTRTATCAN